ncbi:MAG TPA: signal recognition particle-docking protein FtsY [Thermoplasmata archaeon]|jgi:fused signal recognition particle receptor|nr:signal recognition particle-docking protein FtsY [Thermoplasmata archaeon]
MFERLKERLLGWRAKAAEEIAPEDVVGDRGRKVREEKLEDVLADLELALLEADVAHPVAEAILKNVRDELLGRRITRDVSLEQGIEIALKHAVEKVLATERVDFLEFVKKAPKPVVIMFVGVNGTGKTTTIARVAHLLQKNGYSVVLAAGDTFRAGAIEQLEIHANRLGAKMIKHGAGADPAAVAFDAVEHAKARHRDVVLIDTAGRMQTNANLMDQMKKIKRVANPHMIVFVGDALAGNDAIEQARTFHQAVGIDAAILCKIDADAKGGAALSIAHSIGKPILFIGTGQSYDDLQPFDPHWMVEKIFG